MRASASSSRDRVNMQLCPVIRSIQGRSYPRLLAAWSLREDKLQAADSHGAALYNAQTVCTEDRSNFGKADVTMTVKMRNHPFLLRRRGYEIDGQHVATGLENSSNLGGALAPYLGRQMMQHDRARHNASGCAMPRGSSKRRNGGWHGANGVFPTGPGSCPG